MLIPYIVCYTVFNGSGKLVKYMCAYNSSITKQEYNKYI